MALAWQEQYEAVIGLEVHCQLLCREKLFCSCPTNFGDLANSHTCPVCLGLPGVLPVLNQEAVDFGIKMALAVGSTIHRTSYFARKQYFYPDLPKNYQITQYDEPYCTDGGLRLSDGHWVRLRRIHFEEDAGKTIHNAQISLLDLNRAGVPLIEIVTEPDLQSAAQAADYLKKLRAIVRYLEISDGNLEEGSFRCDCNVSLKRKKDAWQGQRCEIKNLNSFRNVEKAINYEIVRQFNLYEDGERVVQATLLWDDANGRTKIMRIKEDSEDYRYFREPDLLPLWLSPERLMRLSGSLPELPEAKAERYVSSLGVTREAAEHLVRSPRLSAFFETVLASVSQGIKPETIANFICSDYLKEVNIRNEDSETPLLSPQQVARLLEMVACGQISGKIAKKLLPMMIDQGLAADDLVKREGLGLIDDRKAIEAAVEKILSEFPAQVMEYKSGKLKVFGFFIGEIMKRHSGRLHPSLVNEVLRQRLES